MKILAFNAGSSSLKYKLVDVSATRTLASGNVERIGQGQAIHNYSDDAGSFHVGIDISNYLDAVKAVFDYMVSSESVALDSLSDIDAVGHRVAHAGDEFSCSVPVDEHVIEVIERYADLAPLHNPPALEVIRFCRQELPKALHVAAFDTAFHQTIPARNYIYPIPYRYYEKYHVRRFGFHGTSHKYVSRRAAEFLGKSPRDLKMITCHLGAGASLCAIDHGVSIDTSMGYTPLDGIMMGTRSGSVDPALVTTIMEKENLSPAEMDRILNSESGLLGVSGLSSDLRKLMDPIDKGDAQCELAYDIFLSSIRHNIGAYFFELAGVDCIVCTAGVGENDPYARRLVFRGLEPFGIQIDEERNNVTGKMDRRISTDASATDVLVIPTDEEAEIIRDVRLISEGVDISNPWLDI